MGKHASYRFVCLVASMGLAACDEATYPAAVQAACRADVWEVRTLAGVSDAPRDYVDGRGAQARFAVPTNLAVAPNGTIYVADRYNNRIRAIDKKTNVTTVVGMGTPKSFPAPMVGDPLNVYTDRPDAIAVLKNGELAFVGRYDGMVRKLNKRGLVEVVAGGGNPNVLEGANPDAFRFAYAASIATDKHDNIYVPDESRHVMRIIEGKSGRVRIFAGTGEDDSTDGLVDCAAIQPAACAAADDGTIYFIERFTRRVRKIDAGYVSTIAELPDQPNGIAVNDDGDLYVSTGTRIVRVGQDGTVVTFAGGFEQGIKDGPAADALFSNPFGLAVAKDGSVLVGAGDLEANAVRVVVPVERK